MVERDPAKWQFTRYFFREDRLSKAGHLSLEDCQQAIRNFVDDKPEPGGRIRAYCRLVIRGKLWIVRLVFLSDGKTLHNAHMDEKMTDEYQQDPEPLP